MPSRPLFLGPQTIRLGFVPQIDCAPIVVAYEKGIFKKHGLRINLSRELGWATIHNKISYAQLDAAQSPASIAICLGLGLNMMRSGVTVPLVFNLQGNAITISKEIGYKEIGLGEKFNDYLTYKWKKDRPLILAVPHRLSSQFSMLNSWLSRNRVTPSRNLEIIWLPSYLMPRHLKAGHIDGYCAAEPWNSESIISNQGWCPATSADLASHHPESVLMVSEEFGDDDKSRMLATVAALMESCRLCQSPEFREELISILARREYVGSSPAVLENSLGPVFQSGIGSMNSEDFHIFHGGDTNRPNIHKASWILSELRKEGTIKEETCGPLSTIFREDSYIAAEGLLSKPRIKPTKEIGTEKIIRKNRKEQVPTQ
ncbi:ABC transporter substrate-binding protein [Luteolibacter sp. AS25]|uniref:ABC transporter substrate-binding protein n=1 Tax=Luteolibacter sp. AS25 TaxID=3135776 RepID=UPI00398B4A62